MYFPGQSDFIDIHSHITEPEDDVFRIVSTSVTGIPPGFPHYPASIGLHPWDITHDLVNSLPELLESLSGHDSVLAIGETGLDRLISTSLNLQEEVFKVHIRYADETGKPLIIHCVRAYSEIIRMKKQSGSGVPWIIHGFNGSAEIAAELVSEGFYLSLGMRLLGNKVKAGKMAEIINPSMIFIETDEDRTPVKDLYLKVADLLLIDKSELRNIIRDNYYKVFKP